MKSVEINYKENLPSELTCVGNRYEETKELSLGQLQLFIESRLLELSKQYYESAIQFKVELVDDTPTKKNKFLVLVETDDFDCFFQVRGEIENTLWSFNKQVLHQNSGRFYTHYVRFSYLIKKEDRKKSELKKVS